MLQHFNQQAAAAEAIQMPAIISDAKPDLNALFTEEEINDVTPQKKNLRSIYEQFPDHFMQLCMPV